VLDVLNSDKTIVAKGDDSYQENADIKSLRSIAGMLCGHAQFPLTTQSVQLKQSPVPVMRVDPRTREIRIQRQMGYQSDSFISAPMISRYITIENMTTEEDEEDNDMIEEDDDMVEEDDDIMVEEDEEDDDIMVEGMTSKAKKQAAKAKTQAAKTAKQAAKTTKQAAKTTKQAAKTTKQAAKTTKQAAKIQAAKKRKIKRPALDFKGMRDTAATHFRCSIPDFVTPTSAVNPSVFKFIADYGVQVVPFRFYSDDAQLEEYELLFANNGSVAFMPLSKAILLATQVKTKTS
jgi:hypothetical protein